MATTAQPDAASNPETAVWYFVTATFLCAGATAGQASGNTFWAITGFILGALIFGLGMAVFSAELKRRKEHEDSAQADPTDPSD